MKFHLKNIKYNITFLYIFIAFIINVIYQLPLFADNGIVYNRSYRVYPSSRIWLEGTSTVNSFSCSTEQVYGYAFLDTSWQNNPDSIVGKIKGHLEFAVQSLNCSQAGMNKDMYSALKADSFPVINYDLGKIQPVDNVSSSSDTILIKTCGKLTVAGVSNKIKMLVKIAMLPTGYFHLTGEAEINMTDYGIDPPVKFFGLVRVRDKMHVHFDILAGPDLPEQFAFHKQSTPVSNCPPNIVLE